MTEQPAAPSTPEPAAVPAATPPAIPHDQVRVIVRSYPKVIFFWMTWIFSLVAAILAGNSGYDPANVSHLGTVWMCIFLFNLVVISFDFSEVVSVMVLALVAVFILAGLQFGYLSFLGDWLSTLHIWMNNSFYWSIFSMFTAIFLIVFIKTRFDFWEFRYNEVIHRRGVFADIKRYSTEDLRWFKEIPDVLERVVAGSGRMIITTPREQHPIIIEHVLRIGSIDEKVADILGTKRVVVS